MSEYTGPVAWARGATVGDVVTSIWSSNGAHWEITEVLETVRQSSLPGSYRVHLKSLKSNRVDTRWLRDLKFVNKESN